MQNRKKPLPDHTPIDYWECYAKVVLEHVLSKSYKNLQLRDKPDLQFPDGSTGIEVTQAIDPDQLNAEKLYSNIEYNLIRNEKRAKEEIKKCGCEFVNGLLKGKPGTDSFDIILNALKRKLNTINKGGYILFNEYDLFLFSDIYSNDEMRQNALKTMVELSKGYKITFKQIMVLVPGALYIFDLELYECEVVLVSNKMQYQLACLARNIIEGSIERK